MRTDKKRARSALCALPPGSGFHLRPAAKRAEPPAFSRLRGRGSPAFLFSAALPDAVQDVLQHEHGVLLAVRVFPFQRVEHF